MALGHCCTQQAHRRYMRRGHCKGGMRPSSEPQCSGTVSSQNKHNNTTPTNLTFGSGVVVSSTVGKLLQHSQQGLLQGAATSEHLQAKPAGTIAHGKPSVEYALIFMQTLPTGSKTQHTLTFAAAHFAAQAHHPGSGALLPEQTAPHPEPTSLHSSAIGAMCAVRRASAERLLTELEARLTSDGVAHHRRLLLSAQRRNLVHVLVEKYLNLASTGDSLRSQGVLRLGARVTAASTGWKIVGCAESAGFPATLKRSPTSTTLQIGVASPMAAARSYGMQQRAQPSKQTRNASLPPLVGTAPHSKSLPPAQRASCTPVILAGVLIQSLVPRLFTRIDAPLTQNHLAGCLL
jgi:hypothetical protein